LPYAPFVERLGVLGFDAAGVRAARSLPFVYVFGRSHFAVSFYGANIFPDTISIALEQPGTRELVTGKFVIEVRENPSELWLAVELASRGAGPGEAAAGAPLAEAIAGGVVDVLLRLNSEFANYVPVERRRPRVTLWPPGHPEYFPAGVKHRYSRPASS
jgi:phenylacetate-CoA ligase